ncbi:MAG TPA: carboxypeptidase-like regulatory domain-containing protein [Gemmatimonadaceae bacterium]|nr:carboxypeptidase-like regulatory domain-containing protein [Gemmatimonadaceae bacterium]
MMGSTVRRALARRVLPAFLGLALPGIAAAQGAAALTGKIVATAGAPIRGASVRVPQLERSVAVDSTGQFRLEGLPTGKVTIVGEAPGFAGKRADVTIPASGTVEQAFSLVPNAHVLANVEVRARSRKQLPLRLHEFEQRRNRAAGGRFLGPDDVARFNGRPLVDALKTVMVGVRFQRNPQGEMNIVSQRSLNPASIRNAGNIKPCGIQIWQDGSLLSDPNHSVELMSEKPGRSGGGVGATYPTTRMGADHDYDISNLLSNDYMGVEYYSDLASTPPGFRTGTPSCGTLVLWTRMPETRTQSQVGAQTSGPPSQR